MLYRRLFFIGTMLVPVNAALPPLFPSLLQRLHEAIAEGNVESIQSLIALSADPNINYLGRTALQNAMVYKNPEVIRCLIARGALLTDDIIERLLRSGNESYTIEQVIGSLNILLDSGALKGNVVNVQGYLTPVMIAHGDSDAMHRRIIALIQNYGKEKLA